MPDSSKNISIVIVPFDTEIYNLTKIFRETILRTPLDLPLSEKDVEGEESQIHIAAMDESRSIVGTVLLKPLSGDKVKLRQMAVSQSMQGQGLGRKLVSFAEDFARKQGFKEMEMHARISALAFYRKLGYKEEGDAFIEVTVPTILMKKKL